MLCDLLYSIDHAEFKDFKVSILIVDNDLKASARDIVYQFSQISSIPVIYKVENQRGLSSARNRLVEEARELKGSHILFVDDDQIVSKYWLVNIAEISQTSQADVVVGRWAPLFDADVENWVKRSGYWDRTWSDNGASMESVSAGNTLVNLNAPGFQGLPFDSRLNLIGGEDTLCFHHMGIMGATMSWAESSLVFERILRSRATAGWMLRRSFRVGLIHAAVARSENSIRILVRRFCRSLALMLVSLCKLPFSLWGGRSSFVPVLADSFRGVGGMMGIMCPGVLIEEYRNTHGH